MKTMASYKYHYAIKGRLYPSLKQKETIKIYGGADRFIGNRLVAVDREIYQLKKVGIYVRVIDERLAELKESVSSAKELKRRIPFLNDVNVDVINNAIKKHKTAWKNYYEGRAGIPVLHKKSEEYSFAVNPHYNGSSKSMNDCSGCYFIDENHLVIAGLGKIKVKFSKKMVKALLSRTAETRMGTFTVSHTSDGKCYVSIALASDEPFVAHYAKTGRKAGIDLNIENFLTDSDGTVIKNPRFLEKSERHLKKQQRKLSKMAARAKKEGRSLLESKNYQRQKQKVAAIHKHITNQRDDFLHRVAVYELKNHDKVYAENLKVKNLMKNHCLAKAITDVSWRKFLVIMKEKASLRTRTFGLVDPKNTTQTCHNCGYVLSGEEKIDTTIREWDCPCCGKHHLRDYNAALNILSKGAGTP